MRRRCDAHTVATARRTWCKKRIDYHKNIDGSLVYCKLQSPFLIVHIERRNHSFCGKRLEVYYTDHTKCAL